jgi:LysM domain-containing protein
MSSRPSHRRPLRWLAALALGVALVPCTARAQDAVPDTASREHTHVVRPGDTLWDLARVYLADPFLWPEIYRLNTDVVEDPHWIFPGETLQLPGGSPTTAFIPLPVTTGPAPETTPNAAPDLGPTEEELPEPVSTGPTVFSNSPTRRGTGQGGRRDRVGRETPTAVRAGEFYAAPYAERSGGPRQAGRIIETSEIPGIRTTTPRSRLQLEEKIYVKPPRSESVKTGDRYLIYTLGPEVAGVGQIVIPTGIAEVERPGDNEATIARIVRQFDEIKLGQGLIHLEAFSFPVDVRPTPVEEGGARAKVVWIRGKPVLPSLQQYVVLDTKGDDEVRMGDRLTLVRPVTKSYRGDRLPEQVIAEAQVVKVTAYGATALIVGQVQPAIRTGTPARVTAKMP